MGRILMGIAIVLLLVWAIGFLGGLVTNGLFHLILVVAVILFLLNFIGKRT